MAADCRFTRAARLLKDAPLEKVNAWKLADVLVSSQPGPLSIFRCISELTRAEAFELLSCLCLQGREAVPAAVRICAVLRSNFAAWESLGSLLSVEWRLRDACILAVVFGKRARFARDWSDCLKASMDGDGEAKLAMGALLENREVADTACLNVEGGQVISWKAEEAYGTSASIGRELAWSFFASQCQLAVEARLVRERETGVDEVDATAEEDWLRPAAKDNALWNASYFRIFGVLMKKRMLDNPSSPAIETDRELDFVFTKSVRRFFHQYALRATDCRPVILEGPHGCGKSAAISRFAHVTNTGTFSMAGSNANACFVHMDTAANKEDSNDILSLVGCVVPLPDGGGFRWRLGPVGHAILKGEWLVLENLDCDNRIGNSSTSALVSRLASLRPGDEFRVPSRSEPLRVGDGFRLFATRSVKATEAARNSSWTPPGGWEAWHRLSLPGLSEEEEFSVLNARFPAVADCIPRVLKAVSDVRAKIVSRGRVLDREPTLRVAVHICQRLCLSRQETPLEFGPELALQDTLDCLAVWTMDEDFRQDLVSICSAAWSLPAKVGVSQLSESSPNVVDLGDFVQIGRSRISKSEATKAALSNRRLAMTNHTKRLLERISRCVNVGESVLLNGESGTGKTAVLQELARLSSKELVVINMSRQSDIGDLLGGFRPFEMASVLPVLVKKFDDAFCQHLSRKKNAPFFDALHRATRSQKQSGRALKLMEGALKSIPVGVRNSTPASSLKWKRIEKTIAKLKQIAPREDAAAGASPAREQDGSPPPRKRQRSNANVEEKHDEAMKDVEAPEDANKRKISFEYSDGVLVSALRAGHWVLLDEINLAPVEVLDHLVSLLDHGCLTIANEEGETVHAAEGFALFAAMNPPTDFGKRPLVKEVRSRFTEFFIEDVENKDDIALLVSHRMFGVHSWDQNARRLSHLEERLTQDIAEFYLAVRRLSKDGTLNDASGKCARFSLRTLSIMLSHCVDLFKNMSASKHGERRAAFEGAMLAFSTPLPRSARGHVDELALKHIMHQTHRKRHAELAKQMRLPKSSSNVVVAGFPIETSKPPTPEENAGNNFVVTAAVTETLVDVCRALTFGATRVPILLQGPTSAGKTSLVSYLAALTGNTLIRINNHEHTDISEYLGCYVADDNGSLVFREGPLVRAVRDGLWVVLDELNLAPPEVLESLNRLLDDNKEIRIPETGEVVKAHKNLTLFATQNPPGLYGGRKQLSRAFRGRFIEVQVDELPDTDLVEIIERRCRLPQSFAKRMVAVMRELQTRRRVSRLFSGKSGFVTARDLFRWGARRPDSRESLAVHGFLLLGERARNESERGIVRDVIVAKVGVEGSLLSDSSLYGNLLEASHPLEVRVPNCDGTSSDDVKNMMSQLMAELKIANTPHMARMITLLLYCVSNNEPALLVGPTGSGKTSACSLLAAAVKSELLSVNCHRHTESSDLVGGFRPGRKTEENGPLFEWADGPLVQAMKGGKAFLMDEINMADDAVVERLNAVLEPSRTLMLSEKGSHSNTVVGHANFRIFATMNPGGDFGKKELSPALRNRFTEIWIPSASSLEDFFPVLESRISFGQDEAINAELEFARKAMRNVLQGVGQMNLGSTALAGSEVVPNKLMLSLRDISTWCTFIQQATVKCAIPAMVAFAHGARLVFLDGMSVGSSTVTEKGLETALWQLVLDEVPSGLRETARKASFDHDAVEITKSQDGIRFGPFLLKMAGQAPSFHSQDAFCMTAPSALRNSSRVVRAIAVDSRPVLLEGPPGAGKTSLVSALARAANVQLSRINLSESTEMSDLIGGDIPGPISGQFCFRKGELLRAIEGGFWILLDEMNLASQSVLEGLNSLLDHRRSVFIPELACEVVAHNDFRIFAAQNPAREGCGRRGLPQSFLNRFTKVSVDSPSDNDLVLIAAASYPALEKKHIEKVVRTLRLLKDHFANSSSAASAAEFGLRQVLRWCKLLDVGGEDTKPDTALCFDVIVLKGLLTAKDRETATRIFCSVFGDEYKRPRSPSVRYMDDSRIRFGSCVVRRGVHQDFSSLFGFQPHLISSRTCSLTALAVIVKAGWPCIISGESGSCSSSDAVRTVETFAGLCSQPVVKLKGGSFLDADDLLGGYTQKDLQGELCRLRSRVLSIYCEVLSSGMKVDMPTETRKSVHVLERAVALLVENNVDGGQIEQNEKSVQLFLEPLSRVVSILSSIVGSESTLKEIRSIEEEIGIISSKASESSKKSPPAFCWARSELVHAIENGNWVILEDADQCSPSILDRLNPLLEISTSNSPEAVLLPEAPPNADGSSAFISPHPNFRLFLVVKDDNGQKISRAIVDRSIKLKLGEVASQADRCASLISGTALSVGDGSFSEGEPHAGVSTVLGKEVLEVQDLRTAVSSVCTGVSDFSLCYKQSIRTRDQYLLNLIQVIESAGSDISVLDKLSLSPAYSFVSVANELMELFQANKQPFSAIFEPLTVFKTCFAQCLLQLFLLGCCSNADFVGRLKLVQWLSTVNSVPSIEWGERRIRAHSCMDPAYGLDVVCLQKQKFEHATSFRFDVLVLYRLFQLFNESNSSSELNSIEGGGESLFAMSKRQFKLSIEEMSSTDPVVLLGTLGYRIMLVLMDIAQRFHPLVASKGDQLEHWTHPEECVWLRFFRLTISFLEFLTSDSRNQIAHGMVLLRHIAKDGHQLRTGFFVGSNAEVRSLFDKLMQLCDLRAKYEGFMATLPIPRSEHALRTERDIMFFVNAAKTELGDVDVRSVVKALVNLSSPSFQKNDKTFRAIQELEKSLEEKSKDCEMPQLSKEVAAFPLWDHLRAINLNNFGLSLQLLLQANWQKMKNSKTASLLRELTEKTLLEFSVNPDSSFLAQIPLQRLHWILSSGSFDIEQIPLVIYELSSSNLKRYVLLVGEHVMQQSPEELYCSSSASDVLAKTLLSLNETSVSSSASVAAACQLVSGQFGLQKGVSSQRQLQLHQLVVTLQSLNLVQSDLYARTNELADIDDISTGLSRLSTCCSEVLGAPPLPVLENCSEVKTALSSAGRLLCDNKTVESTPHGMYSLVSGLLWVVAGAVRVQEAFNDIKRLFGIDPAKFTEAECLLSANQGQYYAAMESACMASSFVKVGGDDVETSVPFITAAEGKQAASATALKLSCELVHRPPDFASFSIFENAVTKIRDLLSTQSLVWTLFEVFQGSQKSAKLDFVKNQLRETVMTLFEKSCESLEIGGQLGHFREIGGSISRGLREVQHGCLLALKGLSIAQLEGTSQQNLKMESFKDFVRFPRAAFSDCSDSMDIVSRMKVNKIPCITQAKFIRFLFVHSAGLKSRVLPALRKCFSGLVSIWKSVRLQEESEEKIRKSLFVIKESAAAEEVPGVSELHDLGDKEADFERHFSTDISEVDSLVADLDQQGLTQDVTEEHTETPIVSKDVLDPSEFWSYHSSCFLNAELKSADQESSTERGFIKFLSALEGVVISNALPNCDSGVSVAAIAACQLSRPRDGVENVGSVNPTTYNFYKDSNVNEVLGMKTALRRLCDRISDVQLQFVDADGNHPVLSVVSDAAERALKASEFTSSLGPLVSVLDIVLRKADEWEKLFATKNLSLEAETKKLAVIALRWRRIEVESWPNLLNSREQLAKTRAEHWFYFLYDGLIGDDDNPYDGDENLSSAVSIMDQFLRSSPQGEFASRIEMLSSLSRQLEVSDFAGQRKLGDSVLGLCHFYSQFLPKVQKTIENEKKPLESKMNDFARLTTWHGEESLGASTKMTKGVEKELEYVRLKAKSEKVRRKLHKLCREADRVLRTPVFAVISKEIQMNGFVDLALPLSEKDVPDENGASKLPSSLVKKEFQGFVSEYSPSFGSTSVFDQSSRLSKIPLLCRRMMDMGAKSVECNTFDVQQAAVVSGFLRNSIRSRALDLKQSSDASIQLKKRALVELLRALETAGVSPYERPDAKERAESSFWLGVKSPFLTGPLEQKANSSFFRAAGRFQRLRAVSDGRVRNADITAAESKKTVCFSADLFDRAVVQRQSLLSTASQLKIVKDVASQMANYGNGQGTEQSFALSTANEIFSIVNRMNSIRGDVKLALKSAEEELKRAETLAGKDVSKCSEDRYPILSVRRSLKSVRESVTCLGLAHSLLSKFAASKTIMTLLSLSGEKMYLVTAGLSEHCANAMKLLQALSTALQNVLATSEDVSKDSLASATLRSIVMYVRKALDSCSACHAERTDSFDITERKEFSEQVVQECELAVQSTMLAAQALFKSNESLKEAEDSPEKENGNSIPGKILRKAHGMIVDAERATAVSVLSSALTSIVQKLGAMGRSTKTGEEEQSTSLACLAVQNLGKMILCYISSFVAPYLRSASEFHLESLGLMNTITSLFIGLAEEGYCRPPEQEDGADDDALPSDVDGTGFGDVGEGDASLAKDVSEEIEDEEQLLGMRDDQAQPNENRENQNDTNNDTGVEMAGDFEGELQDMEKPEEKDDDNEDMDNGMKEEIDEQFGEKPDDKAEDIDERLWNEDDALNETGEEERDSNQPEIESGKRDDDITLAAREESDSHRPQPQKDQPEQQPRDTEDDMDDEGCTGDADENVDPGETEKEKDSVPEDEQTRRKLSKIDQEEDDDNMSEGTGGDDGDQTANQDEKDDGGIEGEKCPSKEEAGENSDQELAADDDEEMVGTMASEEAGQDDKQDIDQDGNDQEMDDFENLDNDEDALMGDAGNTEEIGDLPNADSDANMDPNPEQNDVEGDTAEETADREPNIDTSVAVENDPLDNKPSENALSGGKKMTPSSRKEEVSNPNAAFPNPDSMGTATPKADDKDNEEQTGATGDGFETGETPASMPQSQSAAQATDSLPKLEDFEPQSGEHEPNPYREIGTIEQLELEAKILQDAVDPDEGNTVDRENKPNGANDVHEFAPEAKKSALGPATDDQHKPVEEIARDEEEESKDVRKQNEESGQEQTLQQKSNSAAAHQSTDQPGGKDLISTEEDADNGDVDSARPVEEHPVAAAMRLLESLCLESGSLDRNSGSDEQESSSMPQSDIDMQVGDHEMTDVVVDEAVPTAPLEGSFESPDFCAMWRRLERLVEGDASALCEQLRLVLEPTVRSGLAGSFKTGKRLDMKKVIDFVASDFRRDRIWLRRVRPAKRSYDVLVAIDDSESMSESGAGALALAGLVLLNSSLTKLEVGRVGILKFGADCEIVRDFSEQSSIDEVKGGNILSQFSFSEKRTNLLQLLSTAHDMLRKSRNSTSEDDVQLLFIISDGKLSEREELRKQLRFMSNQNIVVAFIVVNNSATEKSNIFNVKQALIGKDGRIGKIIPYMSDFPFKFYTVIHDVKLLPSVLGNALRQWLELMANMS